MRKGKQPPPLDIENMSKWRRKRQRICLGRLLGGIYEDCWIGCCGEPHRPPDNGGWTCHESLDARTTTDCFCSCDCYPIETAVKLAWKIRMGTLKYEDNTYKNVG